MAFHNIPDELKALPQWVGAYRNSKVPIMTTCNCAASSIEPDTWSTFQDAAMAVEKGRYDNIGFVFNDNGIVGIDIDTGYDEEGFVSPLAADIINKCKSYTERSRSGRGFHILLKGELPFKGKNNLNGVEIYKQSRYFIMTGDVLLYDSLIENQSAIDYIVGTYFPDTPRHETSEEKPYADRIYTPTWEKPANNKLKLRPVYPRIPEGCRNICLTSLAGMLHNQGYSIKQIYNELVYCNKVACDPMVYDSEIQSIVRSVTRYKR